MSDPGCAILVALGVGILIMVLVIDPRKSDLPEPDITVGAVSYTSTWMTDRTRGLRWRCILYDRSIIIIPGTEERIPVEPPAQKAAP